MKKLTAAILALLICIFAFASCGPNSDKPSDTTTPAASDVGSKQDETATKASGEPGTSAPESTREWSDIY